MKSSLEKTFEKAGKKKAKPERPRKQRSIPRLASIIGVGIGLIISLNVGLYLHKTQIEDVRMGNLTRLSAQRAEILASAVEKYVESVWREIKFFTRKPTLNASLAMNDSVAIEEAKKNIVSTIKSAFGVRFITKGEAKLDISIDPPIRFTELEMIRRAERREEVFPEAARIGDKWIVNFVAPLPQDDSQEVMAVMMLSLDLDELQRVALQDKVALGKTVMLQQFGNKDPLTVFSGGNGKAGDAETKPVNNSYWQIRFTPSYYMMEQAKADSTKVMAMIVVITCVLVAACFYSGGYVGRMIEAKMHEKAAAKGSTKTAASDGPAPDLANPLYQKADILDVDIADGDEDLLGLEDVDDTPQQAPVKKEEDILDIAEDDGQVPDVVFRAYDIRGVAKEQISTKLAQLVGQAVGSEAIDIGQDTLIVARDARLSSPELTEFLIRGILSSGCNVLNIGTVPTPLMYFATATLKETQSGVMVTASHNPGEYNGFKIVMNGKSRCGEDIKAIRRRILRKDLYEGSGQESNHDVVPDYIDTIFSDVALAGDVSIVIDAANGVTGKVAPQLFEELGCNVIPMFCDLDGKFPNHSPDPSIESNLHSLIEKVKETEADLGVAFDGDGDRVIVVTSSGQIIWPDQLLMMFAKDIVSRNPGADVVFDVKSTRHLASAITSYGGRPIMWKTGHAPMKNKMLETGALLGGEYSGHIFIKDRWFGFDDGMYAAARLIEILSLQGEPLDMMFEEFPKSPATPEIRVPVSEESKFEIVTQLAAIGDFADGRVTQIDGVRVDFPFGWGLVRASNTSANLTLRFEADDEESLHKVKSIIVQELKNVDPSITINWNA